MLRRIAYTAALFLTLASGAALAAGGFKDHGVVLPSGAVRIAPDRFRLPDSWETALRFYRVTYRPSRYPRTFVVDQPGIRAIHVWDPNRKAAWEGFNLYELGGEVRLFVLVRQKK